MSQPAPMKSLETPVLKWALAATVVLPWLNPLASGPTPSVLPWLISLYSVCALLVLAWAGRFLAAPASSGHESSVTFWLGPVALAWTVAGAISCLIGLLQYFDDASAFAPWVNQAALGEAFGNLRQRNQFATLTNIALASLIWLAQSRTLSPPAKWLAIALACLLAAGNAASSSRTGLVQLMVLCVACGVWRTWRKEVILPLLVAAVLAYGLAAVVLPWMAGVDTSAQGMLARMREGAPCASRLTLWSNVLHLIAQKPWSGWGWGELDYAHYITLYNEPRFCELLDNAHNLPLHLAVELGVPAALLACGAFVWWAMRQRPWAETHTGRQLAWLVLGVILLHSLVEYPLWYGPFQIATGLCLLFLAWPFSTLAAALSLRRLTGLVFALVVCGLLAAAMYATWDYRRISQIYLPPAQRLPAYREATLEKIKDSWLFASQVSFAELSLTPLERNNADWTFHTAESLLHFSPEPKVIERLIESATMSGRDQDAVAHLARYRASYPKEYAEWLKANAAAPPASGVAAK